MRDPDYQGKAESATVRAWKVDWSDENTTPEQNMTLASYLIEGPFHPFWSQWVLLVVSLKDVEGIPPAKKKSPDMTHEIVIMSVDPDIKIDPDVSPVGSKWMLQPVDLVQQFKVPMDVDALDLTEYVVKYIMDGKASPDQDYRRFWKEAITNSAEHYYGNHEGSDHKH